MPRRVSLASIEPSADTAPVAKAEQSRRTRALIVETGMRCLVDFGYAQTSMHLISKIANISRGPLHYHFKDKNDLMGAIAESLPQRIDDRTVARLTAPRSIEGRVKALIAIGLEQHLGDHHIVAIELLTAARRDAALAEAIMPHISAGERRIDRWWIDFGKDLGWSDARMRAFRTVFVAALRGLALDYTTKTEGKHHTAAAEMLKDMLLQYLLAGAQK